MNGGGSLGACSRLLMSMLSLLSTSTGWGNYSVILGPMRLATVS